MSMLRKISRKQVTLPSATRALREAGELEGDAEYTVTIRKVRAGELAAVTSTPPRLFDLARERVEGESEEEFRQRVQDAMMGDPELLQASTRKSDETTRAVIALGVVATSDGAQVTLDGSDDSLVPEDFGDDFAMLHDHITEFSSLPYSRLGGAGMTAFPEERLADHPESNGREVAQDPSGTAG